MNFSRDSDAEGGDLDLEVRRDEPLARHSSLRVGGPAEVWAEAGSVEAVARVVEWAVDRGRPWYVVGLGSNVVFPDDGVAGAVIRLTGELSDWQIEESDGAERGAARVGGGTVNAHLVRGLLGDGWIGAEFLRLVPGTFGGAVAMNAGTKEREMREILVEATVLGLEAGEIVVETRPLEALGLSYRHSELGDDEVVISGRIEIERGDVEAARRSMERDRERRDATQPYKLASLGSTFANPEDDYAGRLIDEAGLKGASVGGATISPTHANFFINEDDASAEDFLRLMARARVAVREQFGVELRPEVDFVGFDGAQRLAMFERELC